ncbi:hypothetical protein [Agrobacterium sp. NPDC090283]|uniref:hypothetical protein n=1 Tax=Agrobacterium sp. NPDC090283 TaxID=3363920 RepID=UPI00383B74C7
MQLFAEYAMPLLKAAHSVGAPEDYAACGGWRKVAPASGRSVDTKMASPGFGRRHVFINQAAADFASGTSAIVFRTTEAIW